MVSAASRLPDEIAADAEEEEEAEVTDASEAAGVDVAVEVLAAAGAAGAGAGAEAGVGVGAGGLLESKVLLELCRPQGRLVQRTSAKGRWHEGHLMIHQPPLQPAK